MTSAWPIPGPPPRDELADQSDARLSGATLSAPPAMAGPAHPGAFELVDGRGVYVRRVDGPPDGVPAWYVHGLAGSSTNWTRLAAVLGAVSPGYLVDLPGAGRSDPPPGGRYSLRADAALVSELIGDLTGGPVHLLGNSLGGIVATALAARFPHRVRSLTLISPAVPDLRLQRDRGADPRLAVVMVPGTGPVASRRLAAIDAMQRAKGMGELCFGEPDSLTDQDYAAAASDLAWRGALPWAHTATVSSLRALIRTYLRAGKSSFRSAAASISVPTLVVWGTRDRLVDARLARPTADAFPDGRLLMVAGSGHVAQMEHPALVADAVLALWQDAGDPVARAVDSGDRAATTGAGAPLRNERPTVGTSKP